MNVDMAVRAHNGVWEWASWKGGEDGRIRKNNCDLKMVEM